MVRVSWIVAVSSLLLAACSTAASGPPEDTGASGSGGKGSEAGGEAGNGASAGASAGGAAGEGGKLGTAGEGGTAGASGDAGGAGAKAQGGASGQSGAAGSGAGGMCTLVAKYSSKDSFCNACAESKCCAEVNGCLGDTRCNDDYVNCQLACALLPDDEEPAAIKACFAKCGVDYPEGKKLYDSAIGCVDAQCAGICE